MSSNSLTPFVFGDALVRTHIDDNGNPWFVAKDVCNVLDLGNSREAVRHLDNDEKGVINTDTPGGNQQMAKVSESGLYSLVFRSRKPEARRFRKWVTSEVLPAIRKTGAYHAAPLVALPDLSDAAKRLTPLLRERVLSDALQAVRISGSTDPADVDVYFAKYCAMIANTPENGGARLPGMAFSSDTEAENIRRFADECLVPCRGNRVNATDLYVAFRSWWRSQCDAALPSHRRFGDVMLGVCAKMRRGGTIWYVNVSLREATEA